MLAVTLMGIDLGQLAVAIILNPATWAAGVGIAYLLFVKGKSIEAKVDSAIRTAFFAVEDAKAMGLLPEGVAKYTVAITHLNELLTAQGVKPSDEIAKLAAISWAAMHAAVPTEPSPAPAAAKPAEPAVSSPK